MNLIYLKEKIRSHKLWCKSSLVVSCDISLLLQMKKVKEEKKKEPIDHNRSFRLSSSSWLVIVGNELINLVRMKRLSVLCRSNCWQWLMINWLCPADRPPWPDSKLAWSKCNLPTSCNERRHILAACNVKCKVRQPKAMPIHDAMHGTTEFKPRSWTYGI